MCGKKCRPRVLPVRLARWQPGAGLVQGATRIGQVPLTAAGVQLPRRVTEGIPGPRGRDPHVELKLVPRGVAVHSLDGREAWVAAIARAPDEVHSVGGRGRIVPNAGWMVFFEDPSRAQRVAVIGRPS